MQVMTDLDGLVTERFVRFRERIIEALRSKHPHMLAIVEAVLGGKQNRIGIQVTEDGKVAGQYTFTLNGVHIVSTETGKLDSEVHHPMLGVVKPYVVVERASLEKMLGDEASFADNLFGTLPKYLPELSIKFMR
jgi:hypothetical protein